MRMERPAGECTQIVEIATDATIMSGRSAGDSGLLLDIDSIAVAEGHLTIDLLSSIDQLHEYAKKLFFSLLTVEALKRLEPEYE